MPRDGHDPQTALDAPAGRTGRAWTVAFLGVLVLALLTARAAAGDRPGLVAFARHDGVYAARADGRGVRPLWRGTGATTGIAWSPDGRRLAVTTGAALWVVDATGARARRILDPRRAPGSGLASPSWSPDGRRIAFVAVRRSDRDVWAVGADGRALRRVTRTPRYVELDVDWGPRGLLAVTTVYAVASVVGTRSADASPDVWLVGTDGRYRRNLTPGALRGWAPDWSRDGCRIALVVWLSPDRRTELYAADADRERLVRLTDDRADEHDPSWSPDGRRLAYVRGGRFARMVAAPPSARPDGGELYALDVGGTRLVRLTRNRTQETSAAWRP